MMQLTRRRILAGFGGLAALALTHVASAADYPSGNRPIRIVVPYTAGGSSDFIARTVAAKLGDSLGHSVVVENRPGGNTVIAADHVARSEPDGYTLMLIGELTHSSVAALSKQLPFHPMDDFAPITNAIASPLVVVVNPSVPARTLRELIDYAKANPGKLNYGSAGVGNTLHLGGEVFSSVAGVKMNHVPYKGASQALIDLVGGNIQVMFDLPQTPLPQIQAGKLRALAVTGKERLDMLPDVPTTAEAGVPEYRFATRVGFAAPGGTPEPVLQKLHAEIVKILAMPDVKQAFAERAMFVDPSESPAAFRKSMAAEMQRMAKLVKDAGIEPQ
ncbi:MAG: tripartite tricarboxylate transporter substrate binding protein [Burkholderiaceae bacterium]|nr:tripartite tricarboxylate transporter substrate binding protein [Burkholderiaceae bacterium]